MQNNFFGSKLNTAFLLVLILLMLIALKWMYQNKQIIRGETLQDGEDKNALVKDTKFNDFNMTVEDVELLDNAGLSNPTFTLQDIVGSDGLPLIALTGTITALDNGCWSDGICKVEINNKIWIIYNIGRNINHELMGTTEGQLTVGGKVEIKAKKVDANNYTLVGDKGYYIKVVK